MVCGCGILGWMLGWMWKIDTWVPSYWYFCNYVIIYLLDRYIVRKISIKVMYLCISSLESIEFESVQELNPFTLSSDTLRNVHPNQYSHARSSQPCSTSLDMHDDKVGKAYPDPTHHDTRQYAGMIEVMN